MSTFIHLLAVVSSPAAGAIRISISQRHINQHYQTQRTNEVTAISNTDRKRHILDCHLNSKQILSSHIMTLAILTDVLRILCDEFLMQHARRHCLSSSLGFIYRFCIKTYLAYNLSLNTPSA
ncbi:hypothetical protein F4777DRAFT_97788 [Nemania sp. FL0916]|nr:hypothetical protein F4777DRAFT_97788 [Nemania sp. FL0916]